MTKSLANIDLCINLSILSGNGNSTLVNMGSKTTKEMHIISQNYEFLSQSQFRTWSSDISELKNEVIWHYLFTNIYKISDHNWLILRQYRIFTMIATSRYTRYKMQIDNDHQRLKCPLGTMETLKHIVSNVQQIRPFFKKWQNSSWDILTRNFQIAT